MRGWGRGRKVHRERISRNASDPEERRRRRRGWVFARFARKRGRLRPTAVTTSSGESSRVMVRDPEWLRNTCVSGRRARMRGFCGMISPSTSNPNIFLVSTVRQLVCGSSRNLNPMILGTDPSRVPNLRRGLPLALKAAETGKDEGPMRRRIPPLDDKPFSSHKGNVGANKNRSVYLAAITLDVAIKLQCTVGKFDIAETSAPCVPFRHFSRLSQADNFISLMTSLFEHYLES